VLAWNKCQSAGGGCGETVVLGGRVVGGWWEQSAREVQINKSDLGVGEGAAGVVCTPVQGRPRQQQQHAERVVSRSGRLRTQKPRLSDGCARARLRRHTPGAAAQAVF
jgi:hypothetical protein